MFSYLIFDLSYKICLSYQADTAILSEIRYIMTVCI